MLSIGGRGGIYCAVTKRGVGEGGGVGLGGRRGSRGRLTPALPLGEVFLGRATLSPFFLFFYYFFVLIF